MASMDTTATAATPASSGAPKPVSSDAPKPASSDAPKLAPKGLLLLATGGSGGHIYPALALAPALRARGYKVAFIGQAGGMEATLIPDAGERFYAVAAGKWRRGRPQLQQAWAALRGLWQARQTLQGLSVEAVIGFGGFASFPAVAAAWSLGLPLILHEGNAVPGKVTRWFARRASLIGASVAQLKTHLPSSCKLVTVGYPVRAVRWGKAEARRQLGLPEDALVSLVMGGSQGSQCLNEAVPQALAQLQAEGHNPSDHHVLHSSGQRWYESLEARCQNLPRYHVSDYLDALLAWAAADVAISRAGMGTLSEAALHGVPLLMVPLPSAAENHQWHNAQAVAARGGGYVVSEDALETFAATWLELLNPHTRQQASAAQLQAAHPEAAAVFAAHIDALLYPPSAQAAAHSSHPITPSEPTPADALQLTEDADTPKSQETSCA